MIGRQMKLISILIAGIWIFPLDFDGIGRSINVTETLFFEEWNLILRAIFALILVCGVVSIWAITIKGLKDENLSLK